MEGEEGDRYGVEGESLERAREVEERRERRAVSPVYTGILIQIGCAYTEANWIQIQTQTTSPMWIVIQIQIRIRDLVLA